MNSHNWFAFVTDRFGAVQKVDVEGNHACSNCATLALLDQKPWVHVSEIVCICTLEFAAAIADLQWKDRSMRLDTLATVTLPTN